MFANMKIAAIALLSLTSMVSALPNSPPKYGDTTTSSTTKDSDSTSRSKITTCYPTSSTIITTGYTTLTTYKPITTWIPTTIKSDIPKTYTEKDRTKVTSIKTITKTVTKPYSSTKTGYSTSDSVETRTYTTSKSFLSIPFQSHF